MRANKFPRSKADDDKLKEAWVFSKERGETAIFAS